MAGMRALGRLYDAVPLPSATAVAVCLKDVSGVGVLVTAATTAATTLTVKASTSYGGSYTQIQGITGFGVPDYWYQRTAGTAAWTKQTSSWSSGVLSVGATAGYVSYIDFLVSELADTYDYLQFTTANSSGAVLLYDLNVQRTPENLRIPSA